MVICQSVCVCGFVYVCVAWKRAFTYEEGKEEKRSKKRWELRDSKMEKKNCVCVWRNSLVVGRVVVVVVVVTKVHTSSFNGLVGGWRRALIDKYIE